jgi:UDP-N-acetylmuramate: L-alanyl-gamma-D-glutamyl-meso-diaminopimelate ligase
VKEEYTHLGVLNEAKELRDLITPLYGRHNISNLISSVVLSEFLKVDPESLRHALRTYKGVKRRQEIKGEKKGILVVDDFAHHPTAVRETIQAVKDRYGRRLIAVFEPRSNSSRRNIFQDSYASSFDQADLTFIPEPPLTEKIPIQERFSSAKLVEDLQRRGLEAFCFPNTDLLLDEVLKEIRAGDVVLFMSNGSFDNLPARLLNKLE